MKAYDPPPDLTDLTPEDAQKLLNVYKATILGDSAHPYNDPQHPQHEDAVRAFRELNAIVRQGEADAASAAGLADLEDALGPDDAGLSPDECRKRAADLLKIPGYVTHERGEVALTDGERERIRRKIHALHIVAEAGGAGQADAADDDDDDDDDDDEE